jgi:polyphosphate kinase
VGRFLEHTRVYYFANNGKPDLWGSSADLMKRNLLRRVESAFPVESEKLQSRILEDLETYLADNTQAWLLGTDGRYQRVELSKNAESLSAQTVLLEKMAKTY